jgi:hypothetical protein
MTTTTTGEALDQNHLGWGAGAGSTRTGGGGEWRRHADGRRRAQRSPGAVAPQVRCCPPRPAPGRTDGDDGDRGARAANCGNAGDGDPLRNDNAAAAAVAGEADDAGQENDDRGSDDGDDDEDDDKWGRGA